jgi:bacteriorhodopsin
MLYESAKLSLYAQLITGFIDTWGLNIKVPIEKEIFRTLLKIELFVQIIEFIFYVWLVKNINTHSNITKYRYFDWMITTPLMLVTLMAFIDDSRVNSLTEFLKNNKTIITEVLILNFLMLYFGYLGETGVLKINESVFIGFIPFLIYYNKIFNKFIKNKHIPNIKKKVFYYFFIIWTLYGIAALLPYTLKNILYNIFDLFSKNFFGLFLVYIIYTNKIK